MCFKQTPMTNGTGNDQTHCLPHCFMLPGEFSHCCFEKNKKKTLDSDLSERKPEKNIKNAQRSFMKELEGNKIILKGK